MLFYVTRRKCIPSDRTLGLRRTCRNYTTRYRVLRSNEIRTRCTFVRCYRYRGATKAFVSYNFSRYERRKETPRLSSDATFGRSRLKKHGGFESITAGLARTILFDPDRRKLEEASLVARFGLALLRYDTTRRIYATSVRIARLARQETSNRCSFRITVFHRFFTNFVLPTKDRSN